MTRLLTCGLLELKKTTPQAVDFTTVTLLSYHQQLFAFCQ